MANYDNGQVILPIERYNELREAANAATELARDMFRLEEQEYSGKVELIIDTPAFKKMAREMFDRSGLAAKYEFDENFYIWNATIGGKPVEPEEAQPAE
jgi:hypothetical protein